METIPTFPMTVMHVKPSLMAKANPAQALVSGMQQAMARRRGWSGAKVAHGYHGEYLSLLTGFPSDTVPPRSGGSCQGEEDPAPIHVLQAFMHYNMRKRRFMA